MLRFPRQISRRSPDSGTQHVLLDAYFLEDALRRQAGQEEDHGQAGSRMGAAPDKVERFDVVFSTLMMHHLQELSTR